MSKSNTLKINNPSSVFDTKTQTITDGTDTYSLTTIPEERSAWVQEARDGILFHITLKDLIKDLDIAADLIYLAANASKRVEASIELVELQGKFSKLLGKCLTTMNEFAVNSNEAQTALQQAFTRLFDGDEDWALRALNDVSNIARDMSAEATEISEEFNAFKLEVQGQSKELQLNVITSYDELDKLKENGTVLQSNMAQQKSIEKDLQSNIAELTEDLEEAKATAKEQETKAFVLQLLGGLFSAIGAGLGAYAMSQNPVALVSKVAGDTTQIIKDANATVDETKKDLTDAQQKDLNDKIEEQKAATDEKDKAEAEVKDNSDAIVRLEDDIKLDKEEIAVAKIDLKAAEERIAEIEKDDKPSKKTDLKVPKKTKKDAERKVTRKEDDISDKEDDKKDLQNDLKTSEATLKTAEEKWKTTKAAVDGFSAGLIKLSETVDSMGVKAESRAATARDTMTEILKLKREAQKLRREATSQIESLLVEIKGNRESMEMKKNIIHCLEVSIWALMNLFVAFERASFFWSNIARAAEKLSEPKIQNILKEIMDAEENVEVRKEIYKNEYFVKASIPSVIGWKALNSICVEYLAEAGAVSTKVQKNMSNWLTLDEAVKAVDIMKIDLQQRLSLTKTESDKMDKMLKGNLEELNALKLPAIE